MISVTDLRPGVAYQADGSLFKVLTYEHIKLGRGSASIKVRVKNMRSGSVVEKSFINGAKVQEASLLRKEYQYLYKDSENAIFMDEGTYEQIQIPLSILGGDVAYLKEGQQVSVLLVDDEALGVEIAPKMEFVIADTGPNVKGNSATNLYKDAVLENGIKVRVPLFSKIGDRIVIDTRTGQYSERAR